MKTASSLLQAIALGAVLFVQPQHSEEAQFKGVRRALQTMESFTLPAMGRVGASAPGWGEVAAWRALSPI
jgi:hypothetical protein